MKVNQTINSIADFLKVTQSDLTKSQNVSLGGRQGLFGVSPPSISPRLYGYTVK